MNGSKNTHASVCVDAWFLSRTRINEISQIGKAMQGRKMCKDEMKNVVLRCKFYRRVHKFVCEGKTV